MTEEINTGNNHKSLLQRAQSILADVTPQFDVWARKSGFARAAILSPVSTSDGVYYYVTDSFGMEAEQIAKLYQSEEYWKDTLSKAFEWQCFSFDFNELDKFRDFFDDYTFEKINKIFFLPFGDSEKPFIFVTVELDDEDDLFLAEASEIAVKLKNIKEFQNQPSKDLKKLEEATEKGLEISSSRLYILSLKLWIEDSIKDIDFANEELKNAVVESIADSASVVLGPLIRKPNCIHSGKNGEIKIVLYAEEDPDEQIISHHISRTLRDLLGRSSSENAKAQFLSAGICSNQKGTIDFLLQE